MVFESNQSSTGPCSSTYSRLPRNTASAARPKTSRRFSSPYSGSSKSISVQAITVAIVPGTTLTRNSQCQEKSSVR